MTTRTFGNQWWKKLETRMEPNKIKFAVVVVKIETVVEHIMKRKTGRFAKIIFYFLQASSCHKCHIEITVKAVSHGISREWKSHVSINILAKSLHQHVDKGTTKTIVLSKINTWHCLEKMLYFFFHLSNHPSDAWNSL